MQMKTNRTNVDFSKHIVIENHYQDGEYNLDVWDFKLPDSEYTHRIKFINSCGILAVKGDFGNWVFCREFHPSAGGYVSGGYWDEKLKTYSVQSPYKYSPESTIKAIEEFVSELEETDEEMEEWIEKLNSAADDEYEYIYVAYRETPNGVDGETVPFGQDRHSYLNIIYDAFDEICNRLKIKA